MTQHIIRAKIASQTLEILKQRFPSTATMTESDIITDNVADWDSMAHVELIVALEREFGIEATADLVEANSLTALTEVVTKILAAEHGVFA